MHSTSTRFAGLPLLFNLVARLKLDDIIDWVLGARRKNSFAQMVLLIIALKIAGVKRLSHVNQVEDFFLRDALGIKKIPDQSNLHRFLYAIEPDKGRQLFSLAASSIKQAARARAKVIAIDAHFIQYYGKKQPLAKKGYCAARHTSVKGFKLHVVYDVASGLILAYRLTPGSVDSRRLVPRLLRDAFEVVEQTGVEYLLIDKGFYDGKLFTRLEEEKVFFVIPARKNAVKSAHSHLSPKTMARLFLKKGLAETTYRPRKAKRPKKLRLIFELYDEARGEICEYATNDWKAEADYLIHLYRKRWRLENAFAELKHDLYLDMLPSADLDKITASIMLTLIAYNLSILLKREVKKLAKARLDTIRRKLIALSAELRRAAGLVYVDAVFKDHLPRGRIKFDLSGINSHLKEVIYC